jgi:hypothetical protein
MHVLCGDRQIHGYIPAPRQNGGGTTFLFDPTVSIEISWDVAESEHVYSPGEKIRLECANGSDPSRTGVVHVNPWFRCTKYRFAPRTAEPSSLYVVWRMWNTEPGRDTRSVRLPGFQELSENQALTSNTVVVRIRCSGPVFGL